MGLRIILHHRRKGFRRVEEAHPRRCAAARVGRRNSGRPKRSKAACRSQRTVRRWTQLPIWSRAFHRLGDGKVIGVCHSGQQLAISLPFFRCANRAECRGVICAPQSLPKNYPSRLRAPSKGAISFPVHSLGFRRKFVAKIKAAPKPLADFLRFNSFSLAR